MREYVEKRLWCESTSDVHKGKANPAAKAPASPRGPGFLAYAHGHNRPVGFLSAHFSDDTFSEPSSRSSVLLKHSEICHICTIAPVQHAPQSHIEIILISTDVTIRHRGRERLVHGRVPTIHRHDITFIFCFQSFRQAVCDGPNSESTMVLLLNHSSSQDTERGVWIRTVRVLLLAASRAQ